MSTRSGGNCIQISSSVYERFGSNALNVGNSVESSGNELFKKKFRNRVKRRLRRFQEDMSTITGGNCIRISLMVYDRFGTNVFKFGLPNMFFSRHPTSHFKKIPHIASRSAFCLLVNDAVMQIVTRLPSSDKHHHHLPSYHDQCCGSGSVFRSFLDPDPYSEYGSKYRLKWRQKM